MNIASTSDYNVALAEFERLALAGQKDNMLRLIELRNAIDAYENAQGHEPAFPTSYAGRLELEMFKHRLKQKQLATILGIPESRLSEILRGKRTPNLELVKKMHTELHIPANELLALE